MSAILPADFADLEPFVPDWTPTTSAGRAARRSAAPAPALAAFHDAMAPRLDAALAWLDARPLADLDPAGRNLLGLCLMLAHVALAVETQGQDEPRHALQREGMRITRTPADA
ncbi:hypothetical protein H7F50_01095 [Novosphingobium flavum]|uniref:hypothetical protein n=1 Tax=Novosphingobium aerophilum TaxID=2839843 RepID=UPI00163B29FF|nr:hypothetical protein [Novosphingobium aerophilum]MBC2660335.1 hypothetical protein [Novosphingobium aerophilum]